MFVAYIKKITSTGKVYLKFTSQLKESILDLKRRLQEFKPEELFDIFIIPYKEEKIDESKEPLERNTSLLNLTWKLESFKDDKMIFQLNFDNPNEISTAEDKDYLAIKIKDD